jgi:hypothetical protein
MALNNEKTSREEFIDLWERLGSARLIAQHLSVDISNVHQRRRRMEREGHMFSTRPAAGYETRTPILDTGWTFLRQITHEVPDGSVIISSDHHYWPDIVTTAHIALLNVIKIVKPRIKILNGDIFDGASVSRHPPFGFSKGPSVREELEACQERVHEIELALPKGCKRLWSVGNHDIRFERTLAVKASEFEGLRGWRLEDYFDQWDFAWSHFLNSETVHPVMVKHRHAGGVHAGYNNTMKGGVTMVTGHTHILEVKPWGDYRGRRYGIQSGTVTALDGPQTEYQENSPSYACPGFVVLTFKDGDLLPPELCEVRGDIAYFRGEQVA